MLLMFFLETIVYQIKKKYIARCGSPSLELLVRGVPETHKAI